MATYKKQLKDKNGNTIYPDVGLNLDDVVYSDDPTTPIEPPVVELFSGSANGDVTLSERIDNFAYVEIFGEEVGGRKVYVKLLSPATSDKFVFGALFFSQSYNTTYLRSCLYTISSDALTLLQTDASTIEFKTSGTTNTTGTSTYVKKVIGYRYM